MSDERDPSTDQCVPEHNDRPYVQDLLISDIEERKEFGIRKYGTALQSGNGRDMLQDAYEEAIDLVVYLRGMKDEDHHLVLELQQRRRELQAARTEIAELQNAIERIGSAWEGGDLAGAVNDAMGLLPDPS